MKNKIVGLTVAAVLLLGNMPVNCEASALDTYRNLLINNTYTLKYQNITPASINTYKDKTFLFGKNSMDIQDSAYLKNRQIENIVVADKDKIYEEANSGPFSLCRLKKGDEEFVFTKIKNGAKTDYYGSMKKGQVYANQRNVVAENLYGVSRGDANMTRLLNAILPANHKSSEMPKLSFVESGYLDNGMNYEDYYCFYNGKKELVRYYFQNYALVKIASAIYNYRGDGSIDGTKCILKISEFSPTPDASYLKLPEGLKDVTKRANKKEKGAKENE